MQDWAEVRRLFYTEHLAKAVILADAQTQHDEWAKGVAWRRHHRRGGARVEEAFAVERGNLRALPDLLPDTDTRLEVRCSKDGLVRVGGVDYSVPPGLAGRRLSVRLSPGEVVVHLEGHELARHRRSFIPADVVLDPAHVRARGRGRKSCSTCVCTQLYRSRKNIPR